MSERTRMKMVQSECVACKGTGLVDSWPCGCFGGKRLYPAKAFHTCQGLYFQGKSDGSIEVFLDESGVGLGKFIHITLDKDTWQSMLREIAPGGGAHECERPVPLTHHSVLPGLGRLNGACGSANKGGKG